MVNDIQDNLGVYIKDLLNSFKTDKNIRKQFAWMNSIEENMQAIMDYKINS